MADVIRFEFRRAADEALETITVGDDGRVERSVGGPVSTIRPGPGAQEIGWWRGDVEPGVVEMIRSLPGTGTNVDSPRVSSAVGEWWAILNDVQRRTSDDGALAALLSVSSAAASEPETVISASAWIEQWEGEPSPIVMMRLRADGDTAGDVRFDDAPDAPVAAFVTDELETLGFLGSTFTVAPPVQAVAVLRERPPKDGYLTLPGILHSLSASSVGPPKSLRFRLLLAVEQEAE